MNFTKLWILPNYEFYQAMNFTKLWILPNYEFYETMNFTKKIGQPIFWALIINISYL